MDEELFQRVCTYVGFNLYTDINILHNMEAVNDEGLEATGKRLESLVTGDTFCLVALVMAPPTVSKPYTQVFPDTRVGIVNVRGLHTDDTERFGRRLEKETIAAIAILAGLPHNPAPDCATYRYHDDAGLDLKGRNLSPPQWLRFQEAATKARLAGYVSDPAAAPSP